MSPGARLTSGDEPSTQLCGRPTAELRKLYYDTASASSPPSMAALREMAPASNILFGSDYPFVKASVMVEELRHVPMSEGERQAIERDNALALVPRLRR
jgi:6-methylsalicylate decarboxylase